MAMKATTKSKKSGKKGTKKTETSNNRPIKTFQSPTYNGYLKVNIWRKQERPTEDYHSAWSLQVIKSYKKGSNWGTTTYFNPDEIIPLAALVTKASNWCERNEDDLDNWDWSPDSE